jgi:hypothetical protein
MASNVALYCDNDLIHKQNNVYEIKIPSFDMGYEIRRDESNEDYFKLHYMLVYKNKENIKQIAFIRNIGIDVKRNDSLQQESLRIRHLVDYNIQQLYNFEIEKEKQKWINQLT